MHLKRHVYRSIVLLAKKGNIDCSSVTKILKKTILQKERNDRKSKREITLLELYALPSRKFEIYKRCKENAFFVSKIQNCFLFTIVESCAHHLESKWIIVKDILRYPAGKTRIHYPSQSNGDGIELSVL